MLGEQMKQYDDIFIDYYKERNLQEFVSWCESVIDQIKEDSELGKAYRINSSQLIKKFREEALPIYIFLRYGQLTVQSITLSDDTTNFDATVLHSDQTTSYFEVTCAKDGELEHWENELFNKYGGGATTHGLRANKVREHFKSGVVLPYAATDIETEISKIVPIILNAFESKQKKEYPDSTYLLISFGNLYLDNEIQKIVEEVKDKSKLASGKFRDVFLINNVSQVVRSICNEKI